jgi:hypothetical protein
MGYIRVIYGIYMGYMQIGEEMVIKEQHSFSLQTSFVISFNFYYFCLSFPTSINVEEF